MKLTIAIIFAVMAYSAAQITQQQKTVVQALFAYCIIRENAPIDGVEDLNYGVFNSTKIERKTKCFTSCVLEKAGFLVNGKVQPKRMTQLLTPIYGAQKLKRAQAKCNNVRGANKCQTAYRVYRCFYNVVGPLPGRTERQPDSPLISALKLIQGLLSPK